MRLLSTTDDTLRLQSFVSELDRPSYAILSHTWLADEDEVTFADLQSLTAARRKIGWQKLHHARQQARRNGFLWIWADTCCIDKSSSAELSEAINSMFRWYRDASLCLVYLDDVPTQTTLQTEGVCVPQIMINDWAVADMEEDEKQYEAFSQCRWLTRGWTLQEMLAPEPHLVQFFDAGWTSLGSLADLAPAVARATGIAMSVLKTGFWRKHPRDCSIAQRMSWAARRRTTRMEDRAYSLLGLFGVNMPILYGEGQRAFFRLQEAIMQDSPDDLTIFYWKGESSERKGMNARLLAEVLDDFQTGSDISVHRQAGAGFELLTHGVRVTLQVKPSSSDDRFIHAILPCRSETAGTMLSPCLELEKDKHTDNYWVVGRPLIDTYLLRDARMQTFTIRYMKTASDQPAGEVMGTGLRVTKGVSKILLRGPTLTTNRERYSERGMLIVAARPIEAWDERGAYFNLPNPIPRDSGFRAAIELSFHFAHNREAFVQLFFSQDIFGREFFTSYGWTDIVSATMDFSSTSMPLESWKPAGSSIRNPDERCFRLWDRAPKGWTVAATMQTMVLRDESVLVVEIETQSTGKKIEYDGDERKETITPSRRSRVSHEDVRHSQNRLVGENMTLGAHLPGIHGGVS